MRKIACFLVFVLFPLLVEAASSDINLVQQFKNGGFIYSISSCEDNFVKVEVSVKKYDSPAESYELEIPHKDSFIKNKDKSFMYNDYKIVPVKNGYKLFYKGIEQYSSTFEKIDGIEIEEIRVYPEVSSFYGLGSASKNFDLKGGNFSLYHTPAYGDQTYMYIPFYVTDKNGSVYYNAAGFDKIKFPNTKGEPVVFNSTTGKIESYYRANERMKDGISSFYKASGSGGILPKWAFGFIQSKYGYKNTDEVMQLIERFKKENIKLSGVVLDLYWFKKMGDLDWDKDNFADPLALDKYLEDNGVKLITITEPFFTEDSLNYEDFSKNGYFGLDDSANPVKWHSWWCFKSKSGSVVNPIADGIDGVFGKIYGKMYETGIDGFWTDLGEPENVPPSVHFNGIKERHFHNYFNREWSKNIYTGLSKTYPDKRAFILSRSGFTGSGKYGVSVWSGDVAANFDSLKAQIPLALSTSISGFSYWGSDVGGFTPEKSSPELTVRWYQFGSFTPVFRAHGTGSREPWSAGSENIGTIRKYIEYRYEFLPYYYSLSWATYKQGLPFMRPLNMEYENVPKKYLTKQFMAGDFILVVPITDSFEFNRTKDVYLPDGNWYDIEHFTKHSGNTVVDENVSIDTIPVYIKEGAIIPVNYNNLKNGVLVLPADGIKTQFTSYNDDGVSNNYLKGEYTEVNYTLDGYNLNYQSNNTIDEITVVVPEIIAGTIKGFKKNGKYFTRVFKLNSKDGVIELNK